MKKLLLILLVAAICTATVLASACAVDNKVQTSTKPPATTPPTTTATKIVPKGSAVVMLPQLGAQPTDPHWVIGSPEYPMSYAMNPRLVWADPETAQVKPWMAESWELAGDQMTWTFKLTRNAKFHSGNPVTAHDWEYAFKKLIVEKRCAPALVEQLSQIYEKIWAEDDYTLKVKTKEPWSTMISNQAHGGPRSVPTVIDSKYIQQVGDEEFKKKPSLAGAYKLVEQVIGDYVKMEAFDDCYGYPAYTKNLTYRVVPETNTRLAALKTGEADMMTDVLGPAIPEAKATSGIRTVAAKEVDIIEIIMSDYLFPNEPSPLLDRKVRQALAYAIDRKAISDKLFYGEAVAQVSPSVVTWHLGFDSSMKGYPYDVTKAKQLLKDANYADGFKLTFWSRPQHMDVSMAVAGFWKDIGINVDLKPIEPGVYLREATNKTLRGVWPTTCPTVPADYAIHLMEYYQAGQSWSWCANDNYTNKTRDMLATMDEAKRVEKMKAMCREITEDLPSRIPVIVRNAVYAIGPKVESLQPGKVSYWCYPQLLKMKN